MPRKLIELTNLSVKQAGMEVLKNIDLTIQYGEQWAILGNSGSGKTSLAKAITGKLFHQGIVHFYNDAGSIQFVEQQHRFHNLSNTSDFYYQQRFQSQDSEDSVTVAQELQRFLDQQKKETTAFIQLLELDTVWNKPLIQLSNGENKRVQLVKALVNNPSVLILDNPFTGLDISGRKLLHTLIDTITKNNIHVIIITSAEEIPGCISHIAVLQEGQLLFSGSKTSYYQQGIKEKYYKKPVPAKIAATGLPQEADFNTAVKMINTTIRYGNSIILHNINWEVQKGERWMVSGPNGAGKSTLLSLITADNPQAYANEIYLFDKRRGSGESIWDIKKKIGLVSPEMHLYFPNTATCFEVIASGLFDTIGLFRKLSGEQEEKVTEWIDVLQLKEVATKTLQQLSMGMQRMTLLARALIKNPPLLVLDEPCQGLDDEQVTYFNTLIDQLCTRFTTTLIYVSHYQQQVPACINRNLFIKSGIAEIQ